MIYNLTIDLNETVSNFYPGLSESDVKLIASEIYNVWDYSSQYQLIVDRIDEIADLNLAFKTKAGFCVTTENLKN